MKVSDIIVFKLHPVFRIPIVTKLQLRYGKPYGRYSPCAKSVLDYFGVRVRGKSYFQTYPDVIKTLLKKNYGVEHIKTRKNLCFKSVSKHFKSKNDHVVIVKGHIFVCDYTGKPIVDTAEVQGREKVIAVYSVTK